jgi:energy-coupling factor transporter ATP-binding protein EcfA2
MRIQELNIAGYKNLNLNLVHSSKAIAVIGNNGSGKSNLLEALSIIFKNLYLEANNTPFNYKIIYKTSTNQTIEINKNNTQLKYYVDGSVQVSIKEYLPKKMVAIYSGEEDRLWRKCFSPFYFEFIRDINKTAREGIMSYNNMPQMLFLNKFYWHISLLTLILSETDENKKFVEEVLKINEINKIKFTFGNEEKYSNYQDSLALEFVKSINHKEEYTLQELKDLLNEKGYINDDVYSFLYILFTPDKTKIIENIEILFNDCLSIESLSEGEKKLLLLKSAFEFAVQEDSLFILDEPDAHIHINNKDQIRKLIEPYKDNRQIILTTHSPTITKSIHNDELYMMDDGEIIKKQEQEIIDSLTGEFWNRHQQSTFLSSDKPIILFVEGKHDKIHINNAYAKLEGDYPDLDFEIFHMDGASNIEHIIKGLYTCDLETTKIYISILDADDEGVTVNTELSKKIKDMPLFHTMIYPKKKVNQNHKGGFTVENMFEFEKYSEAYKKAVDTFSFELKSIKNISDNISTCAKAVLADDSGGFSTEDFINFKYVFEKIKKIKEENQILIEEEENLITVFFNEANGVYNKTTQQLKLVSGSKINENCTNSTSDNYKNQRTAIINSLQTETNGNLITIKEDYNFDSPSGAAKFVNGGNRNGLTSWKNVEDVKLKDLI